MMNKKVKLLMCTAVMSVALNAMAQENTVKGVSQEQGKNIKAAQESQAKVDKLAEDTQTIRGEYRQVLQAIENSRIYNQQIRDLIQGQKDEMVKIDKEMDNVKETTRQITPLMAKMKDALTDFVKVDLPFFKDERQKRMDDLKDLFVASGVSVSERYRKVLEAYLIESEYGQTLESYKDSVELDGNRVSADFLKVGRVGLYYLTKDGKKGGIWNLQTQKWEPLSSSDKVLVGKAVKMALKQASPTLLTIPVYKSSTVAKAIIPAAATSQPTDDVSTESNLTEEPATEEGAE